MKMNYGFLGVALVLAILMSGCQSIVQSGLPDPTLTERDKQMMALAEPDEFRIPTQRNKITYQTNEAPGTIVVDTGNNTFTMCCRMARRSNIGSRAGPNIWDGPAAPRSAR